MLRKRIFDLLVLGVPKLKLPSSGEVGVVSVVCHGHVRMWIFTLNSFFRSLGRILPCTVIDDGSLDAKDKNELEKWLSGIRIVDSRTSRRMTLRTLKGYPNSGRYREEGAILNKFNIKLFDPVLNSRYRRIILVDSDIVFMNKLNEVSDWIRSMSNKSLYASHFIYPGNKREGVDVGWMVVWRMFIEKIDKKIDFGFNSGFLCFDRQVYSLRRVEELMKYMYSVGLGETWACEQYCWSVLISESRNHKLGDEYVHTHSWDEYLGKVKSPFSRKMIHFAFLSKPHYFSLAMKWLWRTRFFRSGRFESV